MHSKIQYKNLTIFLIIKSYYVDSVHCLDIRILKYKNRHYLNQQLFKQLTIQFTHMFLYLLPQKPTQSIKTSYTYIRISHKIFKIFRYLHKKYDHDNNNNKKMKKQQKTTKQTYQSFLTKLKIKYKKQKQQRKQNLRQIRITKIVQSSQQSNDEQYFKKTGDNWWGRINRHHFVRLNPDKVQNIRQLILSEDFIQFGSQIPPFLTYYQEFIYSISPYIFQDDSIRIIYRHFDKITQKQTHALAGYIIRKNILQHKQPYLQSAWRMPIFYSFHPPNDINNGMYQQNQKYQKQNYKEIKTIEYKKLDLLLTGKTFDEEYIQKCLRYQTIWRKDDLTEVQRQLECWKYQLDYQHRINQQRFDSIQDKIEVQRVMYPQMKGVDSKIQQIKKLLIHSQTYSYFKAGYADKTHQDYSTALAYAQQHLAQQNQQKKQLFQTDCKVCFCTKNQPTNKVIYCDSCNTSFHQSCYGIQHIDHQKQLICDVCSYVRKFESQNKSLKCDVSSCQICGRPKFPIKNIDGHFYHVSCLILFGFADIHMFKISLKSNINHTAILQSVIENQMDQYYCEFCLKNCYSGMKFKCSYPLCVKSFHPICAYLNGCFFEINRKILGGISVKVQCRQHVMPGFDNLVQQVYLRRYLCNYKRTSQIKQLNFRQIYENQIQKRNKNFNRIQFQQGGVKRILNFKNIKRDDLPRNIQSLKKSHSHSVKTKSQISNQKDNLNQIPKSKKIQSNKEQTSKFL